MYDGNTLVLLMCARVLLVYEGSLEQGATLNSCITPLAADSSAVGTENARDVLNIHRAPFPRLLCNTRLQCWSALPHGGLRKAW